jgi:ferritin
MVNSVSEKGVWKYQIEKRERSKEFMLKERSPMLSQTMQDALNQYINQEFYASQLYLSMSAFCEWRKLPGFAHWLRVQSREEESHALKLFDFVNNRNGRVMLQAISQPPLEFHSPHLVMEAALEHECEVTKSYNQLYEQAMQEGDSATQVRLQWFISEQVEEERGLSLIVEHLKMIGAQTDALLSLDRELAARKADRVTPDAGK